MKMNQTNTLKRLTEEKYMRMKMYSIYFADTCFN